VADHELTYEEALQRLHELFSAEGDPALNRRCRKYVLEFENDELLFRFADDAPAPGRSEAEL